MLYMKITGSEGRYNSLINWRPQRDSNPRRRRERPVSWARLDDGDVQFIEKKLRSEPRRDRTFDHLIKSQVLYQLS